MRNFDDIKRDITRDRVALIQTLENQNPNVQLLNRYKNDLENIDEITAIEIAATTKELIESIKVAISLHPTEYVENFEKFCTDYIGVMTLDGKSSEKGHFFADMECNLLGIRLNDLLCLKGMNPEDKTFGDALKQHINQYMGTNIPMAGIEEQALQEHLSVYYSGDQEAKDRTFVNLREIQRDAGSLRLKPNLAPHVESKYCTYLTLANDKEYQDAKQRISGKTL